VIYALKIKLNGFNFVDLLHELHVGHQMATSIKY
jgi:hypothetical protein